MKHLFNVFLKIKLYALFGFITLLIFKTILSDTTILLPKKKKKKRKICPQEFENFLSLQFVNTVTMVLIMNIMNDGQIDFFSSFAYNKTSNLIKQYSILLVWNGIKSV